MSTTSTGPDDKRGACQRAASQAGSQWRRTSARSPGRRKADAGTRRALGQSCRGCRARAARGRASRTPELRCPPPRRGISPSTSRAMANAGAATEAEAVRAEAAEIMLADHDSDMDASLTCAMTSCSCTRAWWSCTASWASSNTPPSCARSAVRAARRTTFPRRRCTSASPWKCSSRHGASSGLHRRRPSIVFPCGRCEERSDGSAAGRNGGATRRWGPAATRLEAANTRV
jgi:hypothetical protein